MNDNGWKRSVSESGFTSEQRKKVIYGRERCRNGRNKRAELQESNGEKNKEKNVRITKFMFVKE